MSSKFKSTNTIQIYEINGIECKTPKLIIREHWNKKQFVVIEIGGVDCTVVAEELKRAIDNSQNAHNF